MGPDAGRGSGFGNPEQKADLQHERQVELAEELHRDHLATELAHAQKAHAIKRAPWWKRLFHKS